MKKKLYAIVDIETTGGSALRDRITEIAIAIHDGEQVIETFETLVNPERAIPFHISQITGITTDMVANAPKFYEVAKKIVELTEGKIFVAHNVRFDYSFLVEAFRQLGFTFSRRQLCTVRLSRATFPALPSYSLGNLIRHFNIISSDRHRAMADVMATVQLFEKILSEKASQSSIDHLVNQGVKEALLPKNISIDTLHNLPEACGVYYFEDQYGEVVYVGKSTNIRKRIMQHFSKKTEKAEKLQKYVHNISYEITGSELVALLFESHEIKRLSPIINRAQKHKHFPYGIFEYINEAGYTCFSIGKITAANRKKLKLVAEYPKLHSAQSALTQITLGKELCHKLTGLQTGEGACFYHHIDQCHGACLQREDTTSYNERVEEAREKLSIIFENDFLIVETGRSTEEHAVVLIENGKYKGFGFMDQHCSASRTEDLKSAIKYFENNPETIRIIRRYLSGKRKTSFIKKVDLLYSMND